MAIHGASMNYQRRYALAVFTRAGQLAPMYDYIVLNGVNLQTDKIYTSKLDGLGDPAPVFDSGQRVQSHGVWATTAYLPSKTITIGGHVHGADQIEVDKLWRLIQAAASAKDVPLSVTVMGRTVTYYVRRVSEFNVRRANSYTAEWQCTLMAKFPIGFMGGQGPVPIVPLAKSVIPDGYDITGAAKIEAYSEPDVETVTLAMGSHSAPIEKRV